MKPRVLIIIFSIIALFLIVAIIFNQKEEDKSTSKVCIKGKCFIVEIAKTAEERNNGLMFRESLDNDKGMLFLFEEEGNYPFWMKNTLIPLDIIWISEDRKIVDIKEGQPKNETNLIPNQSAKYVLEINKGISKEFNFSDGDVVSIEN